MRIIVAGGGYGGLACLAALRRYVRDAELMLVDPGACHTKLTHLHETVRRPLRRFQLAYSELGRRMGFEHIRGSAELDDIAAIAAAAALQVDGVAQRFDYLVVATGARPPALPKSEHVYDRDDLRVRDAGEIVDDFLQDGSRPRQITVVGGGPSGIQLLFELADRCRRGRVEIGLRLVDRESGLLGDYPAALGSYVREKINGSDIEYLPGTEYAGAGDDNIVLRDLASGVERSESAGLTFLFPGVSPSPHAMRSDRFGRVGGLANVFAAGDCARYDSRGDDSMTAQVAVRQGKLVARNIDRVSRAVRPLEYFFRELGYVISLGPADAVGWLLVRDHVVSGLPAFAIKEAVEAQYDLFIAGVDTYVV